MVTNSNFHIQGKKNDVQRYECLTNQGIYLLYICIQLKPTTMLSSTLIAMLGQTEIILIVVVVLLLFGGKKIPELMRGLGRGVKEFKDGLDGTDDKDKSNDTDKKS